MNTNQNSASVTIENARLSFVSVFQPRAIANSGSAPKFSATILIPKTDAEAVSRLKAAMEVAINDGVTKKWGGARPNKPATPLHDGDGLRPSGEPFGEECKGHYVMTASSGADRPPLVVGLDRQPVMDSSEIYSGVYASVNVRFFPYFHQAKKGIGCQLNGVMKTKDGEPFAGRRETVEEMFGGVPANTKPAYSAPPQVDNNDDDPWF